MRGLGFLSAAIILPLYLHAETPAVQSYTAADGLAADHVDCIVPDSRGFVWFCTPEGLSRFDGRRVGGFVKFGVADGLPHQAVGAFLETHAGAYLVGTARGLARLDPAAGGNKFSAYTLPGGARENNVTALLETRSGKIWCGTYNGLFEWRASRGFGPQRLPKRPVWDHITVTDIREDIDGRLWAATTDGIDVIHNDGGVQHIGKPDALWAEALLVDRAGRVWAGTRGGLILMRADCPRARCAVERVYTEKDGLANVDVKSLAQAPDGVIWVGTSDGISYLRIRDGHAEFQNLKRAEGLTDHQISPLAGDAAGNMWAGTEGAGVMRFQAGVFTAFHEQDGLASDRVTSVLVDRDGSMLAVTTGKHSGGFHLNIFEGTRFHAWLPRVLGDQASWGMGQIILQSRTGEWWAATKMGLCRYAAMPAADLARKPPQACYAPELQVFKVFEDSKGGIWASAQSARGDRLLRWDPGTNRLTTFEDGPSHTPLMVNAFAEDRNGNVWMGVYHGSLYRYDGQRFTHVTEADGVPPGVVSELLIDSAGRLWIAALGGLGVIDNPGGAAPRARTYGVKDGLAANGIYSLTDDRAGRIYVGTWNGVDRLDPASGHVRHFSADDGLAHGQMDWAMRDSSGNLWFATAQGLSRLTPAADRPPTRPSILITDLRAGRDRYAISQAGAEVVSGVRLSPSLNQLHVEFVGFSSEPEDNLRYKYILQPENSRWQDAHRDHEANYPGLSPGAYRFLVQAVNSEGQESQKAAEVDFTVLPPFWRSWWFELLAATLLAGLVVAAHRYRVAQAVKIERMRTAIATDLHDDIGASLSQIAILSEVARMDRNGGQLQSGERLARVATLARELADSMSDIVWSIRAEPEGLDTLMRRMREFAIDLLQPQAIAFELHEPEAGAQHLRLSLQARRQLLLIFKECIHNAARHARCTTVAAEFSVTAHEVLLRVGDNGRGLNGHGATPRSQGGNGIPSMRRRAESLGGSLDLIANPGGGCTVAVRFPLRHAAFGKPGL